MAIAREDSGLRSAGDNNPGMQTNTNFSGKVAMVGRICIKMAVLEGPVKWP